MHNLGYSFDNSIDFAPKAPSHDVITDMHGLASLKSLARLLTLQMHVAFVYFLLTLPRIGKNHASTTINKTETCAGYFFHFFIPLQHLRPSATAPTKNLKNIKFTKWRHSLLLLLLSSLEIPPSLFLFPFFELFNDTNNDCDGTTQKPTLWVKSYWLLLQPN